MRTTLDLDEVVLSAARSMARAKGISLGAAVSELALRGISSPPGSVQIDAVYSPFPVLIGDPEHVVTSELVAAHQDDD